MQSARTENRVPRSRAQRVSAVLDWLKPFASPVEARAENVRWIAARNIRTTDQSDDWCSACARAEIKRLNDLNPEHEYIVDGGWGSPADCPPTCCKCGITLKGEFTEYAIEEEVTYYCCHTVSLRDGRSAERAFRFIELLSSPSFDQTAPANWRFFRKIERMRITQQSGEPAFRPAASTTARSAQSL